MRDLREVAGDHLEGAINGSLFLLIKGLDQGGDGLLALIQLLLPLSQLLLREVRGGLRERGGAGPAAP